MALDHTFSERDKEIQSEHRLVEAATNGDVTTVTTLLKSRVSVNAEEYNKSLFYACKNYMTPLQMACANGHLNCVEVLIANGADVDAKDRFDVTAIHLAAETGHTSCLRALLNKNAECSFPTKMSKMGCYTLMPYLGGTTPLHLAALNNHVECVTELIQYGADYNAVDERGRTSLYIASQFSSEDCVLTHLKHATSREILSLPSFETNDTPLHFAVSRGMVECVRALLNSGSDANHLNFAGFSPLHLAVTPTNGNRFAAFEILQLLILDGYNTNVNQPDGSALTPLHYVCFDGRNSVRRRPEMAKFLISHGANVHIKSTHGFKLLEYELKLPSDEWEVLRYIVRSVLHPPCLSRLRGMPQYPIDRMGIDDDIQSADDMIGFAMAAILHASAERFNDLQHLEPLPMDQKHCWYETIATNPRTLQHYCRFTIRKALGPCSLKFIKTLPIPTSLQSYLLLEKD